MCVCVQVNVAGHAIFNFSISDTPCSRWSPRLNRSNISHSSFGKNQQPIVCVCLCVCGMGLSLVLLYMDWDLFLFLLLAWPLAVSVSVFVYKSASVSVYGSGSDVSSGCDCSGLSVHHSD